MLSIKRWNGSWEDYDDQFQLIKKEKIEEEVAPPPYDVAISEMGAGSVAKLSEKCGGNEECIPEC